MSRCLPCRRRGGRRETQQNGVFHGVGRGSPAPEGGEAGGVQRAARKREGIRAVLRRLSERGNLVKLNHSGKKISSIAFMRIGFAVSVSWQCKPASSHRRNCSGCSFSLTKYDARERLHAVAAWSYVRPEALRAAAKLLVKSNHLPFSRWHHYNTWFSKTEQQFRYFF